MDSIYTGYNDKNGDKIYEGFKVRFKDNYYRVKKESFFGNPPTYVLELMSNVPFVVNYISLKYYHSDCIINKKMVIG